MQPIGDEAQLGRIQAAAERTAAQELGNVGLPIVDGSRSFPRGRMPAARDRVKSKRLPPVSRSPIIALMSDAAKPAYDALLIVSFGGPERREDVLPFLENVLRGKLVPRARMLEVAEHYYHFGGKSPINDQNRALIEALRTKLVAEGPELPIYFGNRNWHPLLPETLAKMADDGVHRALAFFTSAFSSYSGCRQYRENVADAQREVGARAPHIDKLRGFFNHPGFLAAVSDRVGEAIDRVPAAHRPTTRLIYTAHSISRTMADNCRYEAQLAEACRLVSLSLGRDDWRLAYQSRSGPPSQPWLGPDIGDELRRAADEGIRAVVVEPIGFLSDHLEVAYDLDTEAQALAGELGLHMVRAATVGTHPRFVAMIRELVLERLTSGSTRQTLGRLPPCADVCPADCCLPPTRPMEGQRPT
ncbi:MAG TPA: ferrochelatase [Pirellulales bacterium]|nr:ferrochelatase [Pirellulales bacterium]